MHVPHPASVPVCLLLLAAVLLHCSLAGSGRPAASVSIHLPAWLCLPPLQGDRGVSGGGGSPMGLRRSVPRGTTGLSPAGAGMPPLPSFPSPGAQAAAAAAAGLPALAALQQHQQQQQPAAPKQLTPEEKQQLAREAVKEVRFPERTGVGVEWVNVCVCSAGGCEGGAVAQ